MSDLILNNVGAAGPLYGRVVFESYQPAVRTRQGLVGTIRTLQPHSMAGVFEMSPDILINGEQAAMLLKWLLERFHPDLLRYGFVYPPGDRVEINMHLFYLASEIERLQNGLTEAELEQDRRQARGVMLLRHSPIDWVDNHPDGRHREPGFAVEADPIMPDAGGLHP